MKYHGHNLRQLSPFQTMSHPVFLTSSNLGHMPIGSQNQWSDFYHAASFELQADQFVPILWFMLFQTNDLYWARYTDLLDADDPQLHYLVEEYHQDFGDHLYAYLLTNQQQALLNLEQNRAFFLDSVGEEYLDHFEQFKHIIETHYPNFIVLRSSGMPTEFDSDEHLRFPLEQLEQFQNDPTQDNGLKNYQTVALSQFDDYAYFFYGVDPSMMTQNTLDEPEHQSDLDQVTPNPSNTGTAVWICTALVSILTLVVWFNTHSVLYAFVVFIVSAFVLGFISSIIGKSKS